ncbi:hypothetical protein BZA77DRAFT_316437 [Pyronema omphalodes]|nr:hypothetical protein BZA77DRAFT_316437 [Pyronema omphalodes]
MDSRSSSDLNIHDEDKLLSSSSSYDTRFTSYNSRTHRTRHSFLNWRNISVVLSSLLLLAGITVWLHVILLVKNTHCETNPEEEKFEPDLRYSRRVIFQMHKFYGGPPSNATNEMWERLMPPGDGIVALPEKFIKSLPPSRPGEEKGTYVYGISMFHQLHCLNFLRFAYYPSEVKDMPPDEVVLHRDHCLDYIRQAIMCNGDATFEPLKEFGVDGMGAIHQCRDFDSMFTWAYEQRSNKTASGYESSTRTHTPAKLNTIVGGSSGHSHAHLGGRRL